MSSGVKVPSTVRENKKRKAASSIPVEIPPTRGRATKSQKKQSEAELEKALAENKRKVVAKGKKKVVELVEIDEMDLVLRDEEETEEMEVVTPKSAEPSTLAKRTRFALKPRKVKIVEEEEWSREEEEEKEEEGESDAEKDKMVKFGKRTILKGRLLMDLEESGMVMLLEKLQLQGWKNMVLQMDGKLAKTKIMEFMANYEIKNGRVASVPAEGYNDYKKLKWTSLDNLPTKFAITRKFGDNDEELEPKTVYKSDMKPPLKVLLEFVNKVVLPKVLTGTKTYAIPYGFILMVVLAHFKVHIKQWEVGTSKDRFGENTLTACDYEVHTTPKEPGSSKNVPVNSKVLALVQENGAKDAEINRLKKRLAEVEAERDTLRAELEKEKEKNDGGICWTK
ncbi:uncharacterized protein [Nicotiana tomentosiformis]|uniref:uncharacterized protein n=1 Tax=Nicotiana tomentosiformis TaxID=4098 RepID=UPI00388CA31F